MQQRDDRHHRERGEDHGLDDVLVVLPPPVAPPLRVEAEEGEDDDGEGDDPGQGLPQQMRVARRQVAVEAHVEGEDVGQRDQCTVDDELRKGVTVHRERGGVQPPSHGERNIGV
jgi:hypothetical protein